MAIDMKKVREQAPSLCELFDYESFVAHLSRRGLSKVTDYIKLYMSSGWIVPLEVGTRQRFHRGHMLILLRLSTCNDLHYQAGLENAYDFEDIMSRRAFLCEKSANDLRDDAKRIQQLFLWLWSDSMASYQPVNAVLTKAIIDISLDMLDPDGFYENLHVKDSEEGVGTYRLVRDLLVMQYEISMLVGLASSTGVSVPSVQYIFDRKRRFDELCDFMMPIKSPFLAIPSRDIMADERMDFIKKRNQLLADKKYRELIDFYDSHLYYYESDVQRHAELCVCMGHIYGDLLKDSASAVSVFQEAIEYDPSNQEAFEQVSHHMREAGQWNELVELLSNHWDTLTDPARRCALILECALIQAFKCQRVTEAIGLFERCMLEGHPGNAFDDLYKIIVGLMDDCTDLEKMRALVTLSLHVVNYGQCEKLVQLKGKYDTSTDSLGRCLSALIDAGLESFKGDQPEALEILRDAIVQVPRHALIDGILLRIASKLHSDNEFREGLEDLENESLSGEDLSDVWLRVARVLRTLSRDALALEYAEKAVQAHDVNREAVEMCYDISVALQKNDRAFIYATLKAAREKDPKVREELETTCQELRLSFGDDDDKLMGAYETLLQFADVRDSIVDNLRELANTLDTPKTITLLQRVESRCTTDGLSSFVGELYQIVLERVVTPDQKKGLLERYLGFLLGQGAAFDIQNFIPIHAQLFALTPSDRLFSILQNAANHSPAAIKTWTGCLEDAVTEVSDKLRIAKIYTTLADCYKNILKDPEKTADAYENLLKASPDSLSAFKECFEAMEQVGRYFDCTEIAKSFALEKLTAQERQLYASKSLGFALIHLYDADTMLHFVNFLSKDDESRMPGVIDTLLELAQNAHVESDQLICFLEKMEQNTTPGTALILRLARANLLASAQNLAECSKLLDSATCDAARRAKLLDRAKPALDALKAGGNEYRELVSRWRSEAPSVPAPSVSTSASAIPSVPPIASASGFSVRPVSAISAPSIPAAPVPASASAPAHAPAPASAPASAPSQSASITALVKECADHIDDETFLAVIDKALKTLSAEDATALCLQLGALYESNQRYPVAENYFKKAFQYTQSFELLEFYKRMRQFKKALKILSFKHAKAPESGKLAVKIEMALVYEQMGDGASAINVIDEVIDSNALDKNARIALLRQKSACLVQQHNPQEAIATLRRASAEADPKLREDIDTDACFLLREASPEEAKKAFQSLKIRNVKSEKFTLLSLCFDIDDHAFDEADAKITALLASAPAPVKIPALEQKIRLQKLRGDSQPDISKTAQALLALAPHNAMAKEALD